MSTITSGWYAPGSFGVYPPPFPRRDQPTVIRVWFCGRTLHRGQAHAIPCTHETRKLARRCHRRTAS